MNPKMLGRRFAPDPRDKNFPMRLLLDPLRDQFFPKGLPPGTRHYRSAPVMNQGETGTCVAHGWAAWSQGAPLMIKPTPDMEPMALYDEFIKNDEFPDNDVDPGRQYGTSVRAGAKVLQAKGHIQQYLWAEGVEDVRAWHLAGKGTIVLGINWDYNMFEPDKHGVVHRGGGVAGGHCVETSGWSDTLHIAGKEYQACRCQNSWGPDWGQKGHFWILRDDLEQLLSEDGEACAALEQRVV